MKTVTVMKTFRLPASTAARISGLAMSRGGTETSVVVAAVDVLATPSPLSADTWSALQTRALHRLQRALTEAELQACLAVTRDWLITGMDAPLIWAEIEDAIGSIADPRPEPGSEADITERAIFGDRVDIEAIPGLDAPALVAKLRAMSDLDRAVLTLACREWWDAAEPRPALATILGGQLRGPRSN